jgi:hypothetical protein
MNATQSASMQRIRFQRFKRAQELVAYADLTGITIGWEGEHTTFHPADDIPQRFIEEATILSAEIKSIIQNRKS